MKLGLEVIIAITLSIGMIMGYIMGVRVIAKRVGTRLFRMRDDVLSKIKEAKRGDFKNLAEFHNFVESVWETSMEKEFKDKKDDE